MTYKISVKFYNLVGVKDYLYMYIPLTSKANWDWEVGVGGWVGGSNQQKISTTILNTYVKSIPAPPHPSISSNSIILCELNI